MRNCDIKLAAHYFPTQVLLVDDNERFSENLLAAVGGQLNMTSVSDPNKALNDISYAFRFKTQACDWRHGVNGDQMIDDEDGLTLFDTSFDAVCQWREIINDPSRYQWLTTIIVDYAMPNMDGITFCEYLSHVPVKKIMLTGEADHGVAVKAFNQGLIDGFILKDTVGMQDHLVSMVKRLRHDYFADQHRTVVNSLPNYQVNSLNRDEYCSWLASLMTDRSVTSEYYLIDKQGSYIFLNEHGKPTWFIIRNQEQLDTYYDVAKQARAKPEILQSLSQYKKFPLLIDEQDCKQPAWEWDDYLFPIQPFQHDKRYFYCVVEDVNREKIEWE